MSTAAISAEQVRAFLTSYAAAFQRSDKDGVADCYSYPAHVLTYNGGVRLLPVASREAWTVVIERILQMYGAMGVRTAAMRELRVTDVSPQVAQAHVVWSLQSDGDRPLYDFAATYTLALIDGALKIVQVVSENEQPKFQGVMRGRG
ncbi:MAG: nuclear transport factor 2 family protein [Chloroflexota bacterium]